MHSLLHRCLKNPRLWQLALACYWSLLFLGTHVPMERLVFDPGAKDKYAHLAAFAGLAFLLATTWRLTAGRLHLRQLASVWIIVVLYGAIEETTQPFVGRSASTIDWIADAIGATLGLAFFAWWSRRWLDKRIPPSNNTVDGAQAPSWCRYSLRTLFVMMTFVAIVCYWLMLPTMNAQRFVLAIRTGDVDTAKSLFVSEEARSFGGGDAVDMLEQDPVRIEPLTWRDFWNGTRQIVVGMRWTSGQGTLAGVAILVVNRQGVTSLIFTS